MAKPSAVSRAEKSKGRDSGHDETKRPLARPLPGASASGKKRRGPPRTTRPRTRRGRAQGDAGARSTAATPRPRTTSPREASASLWRPGARKMGRRREARTTKRRGLAARSRKADPKRPGPRSGPQTHATSGRARSARPPRNQTRPARFMTAPHRPRGACGHGGGLRQTAANTNRQRDGRGGRVRERDLCTRSLKDDGRAAATPQRDELEAGPGHGPCPTTRRFARRLGRRAKNQNNAISKARDRSGPALYKTRSRTRPPRLHQRTTQPRLQHIRPPPWLRDNGSRSEPSDTRQLDHHTHTQDGE